MPPAAKASLITKYARGYQQALQKEGVNLEIQTTAGSVEALQLLRDGKVDAAFIQGGIGTTLYATGKVFIRRLEAGGTLENFDSKQQHKNFRLAMKEGVNGGGTETPEQPT